MRKSELYDDGWFDYFSLWKNGNKNKMCLWYYYLFAGLVIISGRGDRVKSFPRKLMDDGPRSRLWSRPNGLSLLRWRHCHEKRLKTEETQEILHTPHSHNITLISENINHSAAPFSIWRSQQEQFVSIRHFAPFIFVWPDLCYVVFFFRHPKRQNKWFTFIPMIITTIGQQQQNAKAKLPLGSTEQPTTTISK